MMICARYNHTCLNQGVELLEASQYGPLNVTKPPLYLSTTFVALIVFELKFYKETWAIKMELVGRKYRLDCTTCSRRMKIEEGPWSFERAMVPNCFNVSAVNSYMCPRRRRC